ncbi:ABC transporter ATP-binding protein [Natrinema hispanicum]|uniref:ATP-binding cassette, subfamily B n=1 Tax=Natrinema hispanicum TaxID=392421 RepID=A0A1G6RHI3_9EURY|nr:ABC transporter ATP-binding protein [Natrinema hispanicum]SDD04119.1 ATP-binding cassette, subfamily B [Natrinema hispanicum]SET56006.1 ATP-binding cassette, subfamily B [Natrinema hispanicum]
MNRPDGDEDDPFEDQRAEVENPMKRLFLEYGVNYVGAAVIGVIASVGARVLDLLPPLMLGIAIDAVIRQEIAYAAAFPVGGGLIEPYVPTGRVDQFWLTIGIIASAFLCSAIFHWTRNWGFNTFAQNIQHDIRTDTYDEMQRLDMGFFADKQTGEMMSILSNDVNRLEKFLNDGMNSLFRLLVMVVGIGGLLLAINWQLALVALLPVPLIAGFTYLFIQTIQPKYAEVRSTVGTVNSRLENNLGGIQVIKSSTTESYESDRVEDVSQEYFDANWGAIRTRIKFFPGLRVLAGIGFVITFLVGGLWVISGPPGPFSGELSTGMFVVFILYTQRFIWPMAQFGQIINMYQRARASSARIFGLMDEPNRVDEEPDAPDLTVTDGRVEYNEVSFSYDDRETQTSESTEPILENIDFSVEGGETLALVGPTGAGKSTVLKLLLRMYDVDEGEIRIDGQNIQDVTLRSLRESIGYVSQDTFLFYGSVAENIKYGTFDADREAVIEAAKMAEAHEFIQNLPDGYDTEVGERGVKLSGGQRQRLSIARAILRDPAILVLDEATSDVDTETEMLIQRSIDELAEDRTTFAIAHRLSTIKDADGILVLEGGEIVERGTHEELLTNDGLYSHLWGVQAGEIDELPQEFIERAQRRQAQTEADDD